MTTTDQDYVHDKSRRIVGHDALKRSSRIVQDWRMQEQENSRLAKRFAIVFLIVAVLLAAAFFPV